MYAIIETGGKQYRVTPGDVISFERLQGNVGQTVTFDKVLLIGGKSDSQVLVGTPYVAQASLQAEIVEQAKDKKLLTIKYKRRKGYRRTIGHRQQLTRLLITKIEDGRGQSLMFEASKRAEVLSKASVPFSKRQETHQAKHATSGAAGAKKVEASAAAATTAKKRTTTATAAPKAKKTTSKKKA